MKELINSIAGVVILFNPSGEVFNTILSYVNQVKKLYVIDNSTLPDHSLVGKLRLLDQAHYVHHNGNKGVAAALNTAARLAVQDGFRFLLTMDQDTKLPPGFVAQLAEVFSFDPATGIGIASPHYSLDEPKGPGRYENILYTMTSGNILNLEIYREVGPFREELFIDHVDHEFCLRLHEHGYAVIQDNFSRISHTPGNTRAIRIFGKTFSFSSHAPVRLYYYCRNGMYVSKLYGRKFPQFRHRFRKLILKEIAKIPVEKEKLLRIRMLLKAYRDYKTKRMGSID